MNGTLIRKFETAQFTVIVDAIDEDSPDLSWDEDGTTQAGIESGKYVLFCARARVIHAELGELASDYLGNCVYESLKAFAEPQGYFGDMVRSVCDAARNRLLDARAVYVRQS